MIASVPKWSVAPELKDSVTIVWSIVFETRYGKGFQCHRNVLPAATFCDLKNKHFEVIGFTNHDSTIGQSENNTVI